MMKWGSLTTLDPSHSQNSPNNTNNNQVVHSAHSPSINSNSINETDGKTKDFYVTWTQIITNYFSTTT